MIAHLRCPDTHQGLTEASAELLTDLRARREALRNRDGEIPELFTGGLTTLDGRWFYPRRDAIPVLLPGEAIPLA